MKSVCILILSSLFILSSEPDIKGTWVLQEDTSIKLVFDDKTVSCFGNNELLYIETYKVDISTDAEPELIMYAELDTTSFYIEGLTDSTLTLIDGSQGNILFYRREK